MVGVVDLDPGAVASAARAEVLPVGRMPEEDADRAAAGRAVRLGAADGREAKERGPVAGQERQGHRHLLDIEQSQPV